jgi:hypothetical protein
MQLRQALATRPSPCLTVVKLMHIAVIAAVAAVAGHVAGPWASDTFLGPSAPGTGPWAPDCAPNAQGMLSAHADR